jgi:anti-sigma B factor antagonist
VSGERQLVWVGRVAVVTLPVEVDISNAEQVREDLLSVVTQDASLVIADMTATTFCDSAGVSALVRVARRATVSGSALRLAASAPAVTRVLALTWVDKLIKIYPSLAAALADPGDDVAAGTADQAAHSVRPGQSDPGGRAPQPG